MLNIRNSGLRSLKEVNIQEDITKLNCQFNKLETLEGLEKCVNFKLTKLNIFNISSLGLRSLKEVNIPKDITELYCSNNKLETLKGLEKCVNLTLLKCNNNKLETLKRLDKCVKLTELYCSRNELETLEGIEKCNKLTKLDCSNNKLRKLKYCPESIEFIVYDNNPIKIQLEQVGYRDRGRNIDEIHRINKEKWERSIYKEGMKEDNFL